MGPKQGGSGNNNTSETSGESQLRKKRKKNKKPKDTQQDRSGITAAATKDKVPALPQKDPAKVPTPSYCFRCGETDHTSRTCKHTGDLQCDNYQDTKSHLTKACSLYRKANNLVAHPWLLRTEGSANRAQAENEDEIFGSHPDNSVEVLSEADNSLNQPDTAGWGGLPVYHMSLTPGALSSGEDE